jgi:hypothetical protein
MDSHWMKTEAGKKRMSRIQKKAWKKRRAESKAETLVKKAKANGKPDADVYAQAVQRAISRKEIPKLMSMLAHSVLMEMMGGRK